MNFFTSFSPKPFLLFLLLVANVIFAQTPSGPKIPVEILTGHENLYFQLVLKKPLDQKGKFNFFGLATYTADYNNDPSENRLITITQLSYTFDKGFGIMAGTDMNSFSGFSPVIGPQHNFANKEFLAVTVASFFMNNAKDFKLFGLYEYKPQLSNTLSLYSRFQFIYNQSISFGNHNKSYVYLRGGLKQKNLIYGMGLNLSWSGPERAFASNIGPFIRWEFN